MKKVTKKKTTKKKTGSKNKGGRPKIEIDYAKLEGLAQIQATNQEICAVMGFHEDTFYDKMKNDPKFSETIKRGKESGKASLRRLQYLGAQKGNTTMLVWLGKNVLGQSDNPQEQYDDELSFVK